LKKNLLHLITRDGILILFSVAVLLYVILSLFKIITTSAPDFPSYYFATLDLLQHKNPYEDTGIPNKYIYPTASSLFYLPFIVLPYPIAQGSFIILSALTVPLIGYISVQVIYKRFSWRQVLLFTSLAFLSFPVKFTLGMGQVNLLALLFLMVGFSVYKQNRWVLGGLFVGIAFLMKPILSFMILFFILNKAWRTISSLVVTLLLLFLISFILYGVENEIFYVSSVVPSLISGTEGREVYYNQGIMGFVSRLTEDGFIRKYGSLIFNLLLVGVALYTIKRQKIDANTQFALFLTLLPIVHSLSWQHYFVILLFPFILLTKKIFDEKRYPLFALLLVSYLLISWNIKNPSHFLSFPGSFVLSHTFFGAVILLLLLYTLSLTKRKH
jgi:alpha-1,2-mannosyltransferase